MSNRPRGFTDLQNLINSGAAWTLGDEQLTRVACDAIDEGHCLLPPERVEVSEGKYVKARGDKEPGDEGTREHVLRHHTESFVQALELCPSSLECNSLLFLPII